LDMAFHLLSYVNYTLDYGVTYSTKHSILTGYCDASWLSCKDTSRSNTGFVFMQNNGAVSWQSKLQSSIALSTAEAEYQSMGKTGKEGVWLHRLIMHDMLNTEVHDALPCMMPEQQYMAADTKKRNHDLYPLHLLFYLIHNLPLPWLKPVLHLRKQNTLRWCITGLGTRLLMVNYPLILFLAQTTQLIFSLSAYLYQGSIT
jgi:hypothetical protein